MTKSTTDFKVIVCAAIKNSENKILIAQRKKGLNLGGKWEFPGGKLEHGEELEAAIKREIKEELDIEVHNLEILHIRPYVYPHNAVLIIFYLCDFLQGELKLIDHEKALWLTVEEIQQLDLLPANQEAMRKLKEKLS